MKKAGIVAGFVTLYAVFFNISPLLGLSEKAIFGLFALSPFLTVYMVYIVLKYGKSGNKTFDEQFYEDHPYQRNGREELG